MPPPAACFGALEPTNAVAAPPDVDRRRLDLTDPAPSIRLLDPGPRLRRRAGKKHTGDIPGSRGDKGHDAGPARLLLHFNKYIDQ